jgi:nitrile hydratase
MPKIHDRGGWPDDEPIDTSEHEWMDWQWQTQVLPGVLRSKGLMVADELRRGIESIPPEQYEVLPYHEKWSTSIESLLVEKGILTKDEIDEKAKAIEERWG